MKTFAVVIKMRAECQADAYEMIQDYLGEETDVDIISSKEL
jgi:hypothetical protein